MSRPYGRCDRRNPWFRIPGGRPFRATSLALGVLALASCDEGAQEDAAAPAATPPPAVSVVEATLQPFTPSAVFNGRIEAVDEVILRARVSGFLEERNFVEGQDVEQGALLFRIEKAPYEAEVARLEAAVAQAEAEVELARLEETRQSELVARQATAQARLDEARARLGSTRGVLMQQQAALRRAELDLSYTDISAPIAGRIGRAQYSVGNFVGPESGALALIVSQDPIYVTFPVSSRQLLEVREGARARGIDPRAVTIRLRLPDDSIYEHPGTLNFVDVQVDPTTDTVTIRGEMPNPDRKLIDNQLVGVIVEEAEPETGLMIPQSALLVDQGGPYVLTIDEENVVTRSPITSGGSQGTAMIVESGLQPGQRVIVEGLQKVRPGIAVEPTTVPPPSGA
jgi:membrane fusion protein, multidrug efflux system